MSSKLMNKESFAGYVGCSVALLRTMVKENLIKEAKGVWPNCHFTTDQIEAAEVSMKSRLSKRGTIHRDSRISAMGGDPKVHLSENEVSKILHKSRYSVTKARERGYIKPDLQEGVLGGLFLYDKSRLSELETAVNQYYKDDRYKRYGSKPLPQETPEDTATEDSHPQETPEDTATKDSHVLMGCIDLILKRLRVLAEVFLRIEADVVRFNTLQDAQMKQWGLDPEAIIAKHNESPESIT